MGFWEVAPRSKAEARAEEIVAPGLSALLIKSCHRESGGTGILGDMGACHCQLGSLLPYALWDSWTPTASRKLS